MLNRAMLFLCAALAVSQAACTRRGPPYSPRQALETFQVPPGFRVELVAAEPEIADPVAMAFDERGRLFVVEMPGYPLETRPLGRVKLLEDTDGDGRFEKSTLFTEGLGFANGVMPWKGGVLVTTAPDVVYFADTNGDGRADVRRVVLTGFAKTNPQLLVNGLQYGFDNWIYGAYPKVGMPRRYMEEFGNLGEPIRFEGHPEVPPVDIFKQGMDFRFRPGELKLEAVSGNSQFGHSFDARGNRFTLWNNDHIRHVVIQSRYLARNPYLAVSSAMDSISDHEKSARVKAITERPLHIHESEIGHFTSACGLSIYAGGKFPAAYEGASFVCEPAHNLVHADLLSPHGATYKAARFPAAGAAEFLASTDSWFRPVMTAAGPDGALYVVDYYRKVIDHPEWLPPEMLKRKDLRDGSEYGRIYRIVSGIAGGEASGAAKPPEPFTDTADGLLQALTSENQWRRITAQRLIVERGVEQAVEQGVGRGVERGVERAGLDALRALARTAPSPYTRIHALWTLDGLGAMDAGLVLAALDDPIPAVREHALRLAENFLADLRVVSKIRGLVHDPDSRVQFQLACTLGLIEGPESFEALLKIAQAQFDDQWFQVAVLASAAETANLWYRRVTATREFAAAPSEPRKEFVRRIASIIGARRKSAEAGEVVAASAAQPGGWWQAAGLEGLAEGLVRGLPRGSGARAKLSPSGQKTLLGLLEAPSSEVRGAAAPRSVTLRAAALRVAGEIDLTNTPGLRALLRKAAATALHVPLDLGQAGDDRRIIAAGVLALDRGGSALPVLEKLLTPQQPEPLQVAAAAAVARIRSPQALALLLNRWSSFTAPVRDAATPALFGDPARVSALLDAVAGGQVPPWSIAASRRMQLMRSPDPAIRKRAEALFSAAEGQRRQVVERYRAALALRGDPARGQKIYADNCGKCHKLGGLGVEVGPALDGLSRTREALLTDILDPSSTIVPGYEEYVIETTGGAMVTGIVARQTAAAVTVRHDGTEETILRGRIKELRALRVSQMPEDLEKKISVEAMADLLAFLKGTGGGGPPLVHSHE